MKDLKKLANQCMAELDAIGVQYGNVISWEVNTRAKTVGDNAVTLAGAVILSISQTDCLMTISRTRPQNRQLFMNCYIALTAV